VGGYWLLRVLLPQVRCGCARVRRHAQSAFARDACAHQHCGTTHVSCVMCHVSCVMCHVSCVMCHVSCVMCHACR
jgi:hypothetical protein